MKKLTRASIDELKQEMPVMNDEQQREIVGGGYVYDATGGFLGTDNIDSDGVYVMDSFLYRECKHHAEYQASIGNGCGEMNVVTYGAKSLSQTDAWTQRSVVSTIYGEFCGVYHDYNFSSGTWFAHYSNQASGYTVYIANDKSLDNKDSIIYGVDSAVRNARVID